MQDRIAADQNFGANYETRLTAQMSGIRDADATKSITDMVQAQTQEQAALASRAKLPTTSLFDFLA